ncbi:MAG: D-aminoacylase [Pirellulales bacterium]
MRCLIRGMFLLCLACAICGAVCAAEPVDADIVLRGGSIIDGSGSPAKLGDVAIKGDRIVAVGEFAAGNIGREIDCTGLIVAPGFIDLHNHSDDSVVQEKTRPVANYITQGCTTIVTGNCGGGAEDVAKFLDTIDKHGAGTNVAHLIPHGALRAGVLGQVRVKPNDEQLAKMRDRVAEGMNAGAWGMSTGLIYVPGAYADTDELVALSEVVAEHGGIYASHIRDEGSDLLGAIDEALEIGRRAKVPVHVSHFKVVGKPYWGTVRPAAKLLEAARAEGMRVTADQYPYIATSTSLSAMVLPDWAREGGKEATAKRVQDEVQLARIRPELEKALEEKPDIRPVTYKPKPEYAGRSLREIAESEKRPVIDLVLEILVNGDAQAVNFGLAEEDVRFVMQLPWVATASDGSSKLPSADKVHPRSFGTFSRKLGKYAIREHVLPLEQAIRSSSGLPADILGLPERGYLRPGHFADIVAFDPAEFIDRATFDEPDLYSSGLTWALVNGEMAVEQGRPTEALAGRTLRHAAALAEKPER